MYSWNSQYDGGAAGPSYYHPDSSANSVTEQTELGYSPASSYSAFDPRTPFEQSAINQAFPPAPFAQSSESRPALHHHDHRVDIVSLRQSADAAWSMSPPSNYSGTRYPLPVQSGSNRSSITNPFSTPDSLRAMPCLEYGSSSGPSVESSTRSKRSSTLNGAPMQLSYTPSAHSHWSDGSFSVDHSSSRFSKSSHQTPSSVTWMTGISGSDCEILNHMGGGVSGDQETDIFSPGMSGTDTNLQLAAQNLDLSPYPEHPSHHQVWPERGTSQFSTATHHKPEQTNDQGGLYPHVQTLTCRPGVSAHRQVPPHQHNSFNPSTHCEIPKIPKSSSHAVRITCTKCPAQPNFHSQHELKRHDEHHHCPKKAWICTDSGVRRDPWPQKPLNTCKNCRAQHQYMAVYNAAAHLRRIHFHPRGQGGKRKENRGGTYGGDQPSIEVLKRNGWLTEIEIADVCADDPAPPAYASSVTSSNDQAPEEPDFSFLPTRLEQHAASELGLVLPPH